MTLPESRWSKDNPRPIPQVHVPFKDRVERILQKAVKKNQEEIEKERKKK